MAMQFVKNVPLPSPLLIPPSSALFTYPLIFEQSWYAAAFNTDCTPQQSSDQLQGRLPHGLQQHGSRTIMNLSSIYASGGQEAHQACCMALFWSANGELPHARVPQKAVYLAVGQPRMLPQLRQCSCSQHHGCLHGT